MRRRRDPVPRARAAGHWLGGILLLGLLAGGVIAAAVLLWENLDVRQLAPGLSSDPGPLPEPDPPAPPAIQPGAFPVVLFNSPRNHEFFPDEAYYPQALGRWRGLIEGLTQPVLPDDVRGILRQGGTILRTSRTNPFRQETGGA